ncbi:MAG: hypothetical protein Q8Q73_13570 [Stagnimonas sp.]|nr:hypothetical protein [Stagnimonas sp.]
MNLFAKLPLRLRQAKQKIELAANDERVILMQTSPGTDAPEGFEGVRVWPRRAPGVLANDLNLGSDFACN